MGFPIRKSLDQSSFAAPQGLSQRTTSFIASQRQGIHRMPLRHLIALIVDAHPPREREGGSGDGRPCRRADFVGHVGGRFLAGAAIWTGAVDLERRRAPAFARCGVAPGKPARSGELQAPVGKSVGLNAKTALLKERGFARYAWPTLTERCEGIRLRYA